jgi:hypothetical protein
MSLPTHADLRTPLEIREVPFWDSVIKFSPPLILKPRIIYDPTDDDDTGFAEVVYPELVIDVCANNHDDLLEAVYSNIRFGWRSYVQNDNGDFSPQIFRIKQNYLKAATINPF